MPITGLDLRAERRAADIRVTDLASHTDPHVSRQTLHAWEKAAVLTVEQVELYRSALANAIVASERRIA